MAFDSVALEMSHHETSVCWVPAHLLCLSASLVLCIALDVPRVSTIEMLLFWGGASPSGLHLGVGYLISPSCAWAGAGGWRIQNFGGEEAQMLLC